MAGERVLIVDDNPFNVKLARYLLAADGFDVHTAATSDEGLAAVASWRPEIVLMDLRLPGADGLTLTRQLRADAANREMRIVAFSAEVSRAHEQEARDAGCDGYIGKPIDVARFCASVRAYLGSER